MKEIIAYFNDGHEPTVYTMDVYGLLFTDDTVSDIVDARTGEVIFSR